ncbi:tRNA (N6-threonylcarbamoyladenosine(37)-N6)-methyltransferase TrmO [Marinomonas sp. 2405UD68-3]
MTFHPSYTFNTIGIIHSCYTQKFGIPRQPGLVNEATSTLELVAPFNRLDTLEGLDQFSHIWIQFIFHECLKENWKAKIRPPRLGGQSKVGIFSTRATYRPNPIGLSAVKLGRIYQEGKKVFIELHGGDLLDGTPVIDIKPYLPYSDSITNAKNGFAPKPSQKRKVTFSPLATTQCQDYQNKTNRNISQLISEILSQDPRPSYLHNKKGKEHGFQLWDINIRWQANPTYFEVLKLETIS